ncbi:MAG: 8-oxoguanine deaminase, partial [Thermoplasmata archaeon]
MKKMKIKKPYAPKSILIKNASAIATVDKKRRVIKNGSVYIEGNEIVEVGKELKEKAELKIDAKGMVVLPGLVNTHHHLYQTLFRNVPKVQDAKLFDWLIDLYEAWREIDSEAVYVSSLTGISELLKTGCTTASDLFYVFPKGKNGLLEAEIEAAKQLGIRFHPCRGSMSRGKSQGGLPPDDVVQTEEEIIRDSRRIIKEYHDDSKYSMLRIVLAPCSPFSVTTELLAKTAEVARQHSVQMHTHLAETLDEEEFCQKMHKMRPLEYMESVGWLGNDVWYAHAVYMNEKEIKKLAETGTGVAHCPTSNMRLGSGIAPISEMVRNGVKVGIAVDGSASNDSSNMLMEMRMAMLLQRVKNGVDSLTATHAIELGTICGASVLGRDDIGSIEVGKAADLILIDTRELSFAGAMHDPVASIVFCAPSKVHTSIVNGKVLVSEGK